MSKGIDDVTNIPFQCLSQTKGAHGDHDNLSIGETHFGFHLELKASF